MEFILLFGPPAVGKMSVGLEIEAKTGIKLFHNHQTIELVIKYFDFGTPPFKTLVHSFRKQLFSEVAKSDLRGLIFTYVWALDCEGDHRFVSDVCEIFESVGANISLVELYADLEERLRRNKTPQRLEAKPTKRDIAFSEANLLSIDKKYQLNTNKESLNHPFPHMKIDNTQLTAHDAADMIIKELGIKTLA